MDFWIKLDGSEPLYSRNLSIVVTVFKKRCSSNDRHYQKCSGTDFCIRKELFCDSRTNCAWPNGDIPTDEMKCDEKSSGGSLAPANIPIIIIVIIVVIGILMVFFIALKTFYRSVKRPPREERRRGGAERSEALEIGSTLLTHPEGQTSAPPSAPPDDPGGREFPSAPPTYEEAQRHNVLREQISQPPPYTET